MIRRIIVSSVTFIELPTFTRQILDLVNDAQYAEFQQELCANPCAGDLIRNSGGLRKVRMRLPGRGKSGGARVIYLYLDRHNVIVLVYVYTKSKTENLTAAQLSSLRAAAKIIKQEFKYETERN
jgi:hypothetical protein